MGTAYCWWGSAAICKFRKTFFFNWKEQNVEVKETLLMVKLNKKFRSTVFMSRRSSNAPAFTATRGGTTGFSTTSPHQPLSSRRSRKLAGNNSKFCWIPKLLPSLWISERVLLRLESSVLIFFSFKKRQNSKSLKSLWISEHVLLRLESSELNFWIFAIILYFWTCVIVTWKFRAKFLNKCCLDLKVQYWIPEVQYCSFFFLFS